MTAKDFFDRYVYDYEKDALGIGSLGAVYKAYDKVDKKYVAIKVSQVKDISGKFTLLNEVELSKNIDHHANVARYEFGLRVTQPFLIDYAVMDYYEEGNLDMFLRKRNGELSDKEYYEITEGVLEGIKHLHDENVVHRDLKLTNILMHRTKQKQWRPKIADFGLSRQAENANNSFSNPANGFNIAYASPEQIENGTIRKNVDLWAFGVVLYKLLTTEMPFVAAIETEPKNATLEISRQITQGILPEKLNVIKEPYQTIIRQCWILDNTTRVQDAAQLLDFLKRKDIVNITEKDSTELIKPSNFAEFELNTLIYQAPFNNFEKTHIDANNTAESAVENELILENNKASEKTEIFNWETLELNTVSENLTTIENVSVEKNIDFDTQIDASIEKADFNLDIQIQKGDKIEDNSISTLVNSKVQEDRTIFFNVETQNQPKSIKNWRKQAIGASVLVCLLAFGIYKYNAKSPENIVNAQITPQNLSQNTEQNVATFTDSRLPDTENINLNNQKKEKLERKGEITTSLSDVSREIPVIATNDKSTIDETPIQINSKGTTSPLKTPDKTIDKPQSSYESKNKPVTNTATTGIDKPEVNEAALRAYIKRNTKCNWGNIDEIIISNFNVDSKGRVSNGQVLIKYKYDISANVDCQADILYYFKQFEWKSPTSQNGSYHFDSYTLNY